MNDHDRERVEKILAGDAEAFEAFYEEYFPRVYYYTYSKVRDHTATEDLTQEIFVAFVDSLANFEGKSSLLCWIFSIARNHIHNWFRRMQRHPTVLFGEQEALEDLFYHHTDTPLDELQYREFLTRANRRLAELPQRSRDLFCKHHLLGMSIAEIAAETGRSPGAVKTELYRTRKALLADVFAEA